MKTAEEQSALLHGGPFDPGVIWRGTASKGKSRRQQCLRLCCMDCMEKTNPDFSGARCRRFCKRIGNSPVILFAAANNGALAAVLQKKPAPARPASSRWTCAQRENWSVPEDSYKRKCRLYSTTCSILH